MAPRDRGDTGAIRVLHVDDDGDFAELAATYLERQADRLEVTTETGAEAGLDRLAGESFDCVVSDYQMPGVDGLAFLDRIREDHARLPFVLFTGEGSEEIASEAISRGVTEYMQKGRGSDQYAVLANRIENAVEKRRNERELERAHRRFRTLVEETSDVILVVEPDGTIGYATPSAERILGRTPEELAGSDGFDPIHPADAARVMEEFGLLIEDPEARRSVEFRYRRPDGSWIWAEARGRNLLEHPVIGGIVVYARDVTDRREREREHRENERHFRAVFEESFDAFAITDDDGAFVRANAAACELLGLPEDDLLGRPFEEFAPEGLDFADARERIRSADRERGRFTLVGADGTEHDVEYAVTRDVVPGQHLTVMRATGDGDSEG